MSQLKNNQIVCINQRTDTLANFNIPLQLEYFDSFILSSLSYQTTPHENVIYMLWCSLTNGYICTFSLPFYMFGDAYNDTTGMVPSVSVYPNLEILIKNKSSPLFFRLDVLSGATNQIQTISPNDDGFLNIILSFKKY